MIFNQHFRVWYPEDGQGSGSVEQFQFDAFGRADVCADDPEMFIVLFTWQT